MDNDITYRDIIYTVEDPVATITLNRPDKLNAWTARMGVEIRHAVNEAEKDKRVVGIVVTGAGRGFCAGADMSLLEDTFGNGRRRDEDLAALRVVPDEPLADDFTGEFTYLLATEKPVIAAINGPIAGMALPFVLCCDLRFIANDAKVLTAFSQRGLVAEYAIGWLLPQLIGTGRALDLLFSSRTITGADAEAFGLAQQALPAADVLPHAVAYVRGLAEKVSPRSLAVMKRQVYAHLSGGLGAADREAHALMTRSFTDPQAAEGIKAFLEKRPPNFERIGEN